LQVRLLEPTLALSLAPVLLSGLTSQRRAPLSPFSPPISFFLPLTLATAFIFPEPVFYTPALGPSIKSKTLSVKEYLHECLRRELFDLPLTDYEDSPTSEEDEGSPATRLPGAAAGPKPPPKTRLQKKKERSKRRRGAERSAWQEVEKTDLKGVSKKRRAESTKDAVQLDFSMGADVEATQPGWVGKRLSDLPRCEFTKERLLEDYGMTYLPWDGVYAPLFF
jgi:hypothetical protein